MKSRKLAAVTNQGSIAHHSVTIGRSIHNLATVDGKFSHDIISSVLNVFIDFNKIMRLPTENVFVKGKSV